MSHNRLVFDGLAELRAALRQLPQELTGEGSHIVEGAANGAAAEIKGKYPRVTGHLIDGVEVDFVHGQFVAGAIVRNKAKHAFIFENGTQVRHTELGANRGAMPPGHVFVPAMIRKRRRMYEDLKAMLTRHGLQVSGNA